MNSTEKTFLEMQNELDWFSKVIVERMSDPGIEYGVLNIEKVPPPVLPGSSPYSKLLKKFDLSAVERVLFMLALAPHIKPDLLDCLILDEQVQYPTYAVIGGRRGISHNGFLPTMQTALFLIAGHNLSARHTVSELFNADSKLMRSGLVIIDPPSEREPVLNAPLSVASAIIAFVMTGQSVTRPFSSEFPATVLKTELEWKDIVLHKSTEKQLDVIRQQLDGGHSELQLMQPAAYFAFFSGESGTGKTFAASLLGKHYQRPVFRIDCALLLSAHIAEMERKLNEIMRTASYESAVLFFMRSEVFFRKDTGPGGRMLMRDAVFLLSRLQTFSGVVIFSASEYKTMSDDFMSMQQVVVHFPMPDVQQRIRLWNNSIPEGVMPDDEVDLRKFAEHFEINGATIAAASRFALQQARQRKDHVLHLADFQLGLQNEYLKMNRRMETQNMFAKDMALDNL
jgi:hypothetical protein